MFVVKESRKHSAFFSRIYFLNKCFYFKAFSNPSFVFANSNNYYLVFFLLEILNNIIQYQFDGNCNLVYTIIRKRNIFFNLLNFPTDQEQIDQIFGKQTNKIKDKETKSMDGAIPAKEAEPGTLKTTLAETPSVLNMTEKTQPLSTNLKSSPVKEEENLNFNYLSDDAPTASTSSIGELNLSRSNENSENGIRSESKNTPNKLNNLQWRPTCEWITNWKSKLPLQTIMRLLQVLVPQVEKICVDKGLTDESEILKFLQNGTLVGLLPVPHPILIRKYQPNFGTIMWFRTYMWGVVYLRNLNPPIWYDTDVKLFEIQRV
ncbi:unnamed protein product [Brachionus calyciflorus]|uniref:HID1 n=1 Tax=Brachionus calyciflorus TaxID=104777 RepID=A0A814IKC3_9BILA|nr:unnamed protein product [Brachionus calyciflorus]